MAFDASAELTQLGMADCCAEPIGIDVRIRWGFRHNVVGRAAGFILAL